MFSRWLLVLVTLEEIAVPKDVVFKIGVVETVTSRVVVFETVVVETVPFLVASRIVPTSVLVALDAVGELIAVEAVVLFAGTLGVEVKFDNASLVRVPWVEVSAFEVR